MTNHRQAPTDDERHIRRDMAGRRRGMGARRNDWAFLFDPYARDAIERTETTVRVEIDAQGVLGIDPDVRNGFSRIEMETDIVTGITPAGITVTT